MCASLHGLTLAVLWFGMLCMWRTAQLGGTATPKQAAQAVCNSDIAIDQESKTLIPRGGYGSRRGRSGAETSCTQCIIALGVYEFCDGLRHRVVGPPKLLEATLLGLQAVRSKYGAESRQASAAAAMLQGTLADVWAALHDATGGPPHLHRL